MLNYDDERKLIIEAEDLKAAVDLAKNKRINKNDVIAGTIERFLSKHGIRYRMKRIIIEFSD
jgi:hypothetical protein